MGRTTSPVVDVPPGPGQPVLAPTRAQQYAAAPTPDAPAADAPEGAPPALAPCDNKAATGPKASPEGPFDFFFEEGACARLRNEDAVVQVRSLSVREARGIKVARLAIESNDEAMAARLPAYIPRFVWRDAKHTGAIMHFEDDLPNDPTVLDDVAQKVESKALRGLPLPVTELPYTRRGGRFRRWVSAGQTRLYCEGEIRGLNAWCADECSSTVCYDPRGGVAYLGDGAGYPRGEFVKEGASLPLSRLQDPWAGKRPNDR